MWAILAGFQKSEPPFVSWRMLQKIDFEEKFVKSVEAYMLFPKFPAQLQQYSGKQIQVTGYAIPTDVTGATLALSANPYEQCFFCGKAGPASVMTIKLKKKSTQFQTDDYVAFKGTLRLNASNINEFYYILEQAELIMSK
jgi:uncharacterized membrane protein YcgQ (UPF0703/DUF1980 family)